VDFAGQPPLLDNAMLAGAVLDEDQVRILTTEPRFQSIDWVKTTIETGSVLFREPAAFAVRLKERMAMLAEERSDAFFRVPICILLVPSPEYGGDAVGDELVRRIELLDSESRQYIDFYFAGWERDTAGKPSFSIRGFQNTRALLRENGFPWFGGNSDVILLDALWKEGRIYLCRDDTIHSDLSKMLKMGKIATLGSFLGDLIMAAERASRKSGKSGKVSSVSNQLGLMVFKESAIGTLLEEFGGVFGAEKIAEFATKEAGEPLDLDEFLD
jgi:hypothetical protein